MTGIVRPMKPVHTTRAPQPVGPYSQAVTHGQFLFLSGQISIHPATGEVIKDDVASQTRRVMENLRAVLEAAGSGFDRVVKTTIFLKDLNDFAKVNEVYATYFPKDPPARSTIQAAALPKDVDVEIDCIAAT